MSVALELDRLDFKLPREQKKLIKRASETVGMSMKDFVLSLAYEKAQEVLERHHTIKMNEAQSRAFVEMLEKPPAPNEKLQQAFKRHSEVITKSA